VKSSRLPGKRILAVFCRLVLAEDLRLCAAAIPQD